MITMQLHTLIYYEFKILLKQKAFLAALAFPMMFSLIFSVGPVMVLTQDPLTLYVLNQDVPFTVGNNTYDLGNQVLSNLEKGASNASVIIETLQSFDEFITKENAILLPQNFSLVAYTTLTAFYFMRVSSSDIRVETIMDGYVNPTIFQTMVDVLNISRIPQVAAQPFLTLEEINNGQNEQDRRALAFPLTYMVFLILMIGSSFMRIVSFTKEKQNNMMEVVLASVRNRTDLIMSKIAVGLTIGLLIPISYIVGVFLGYLINRYYYGIEFDNPIVLPTDIFTIPILLAILFLFFGLNLTTMGMTLLSQLIFGREVGDRISNFLHIAMAFVFYFTLIADPFTETILQILNPYFWPYRIVLNIIFHQDLIKTVGYALVFGLVNFALIKSSSAAIQQEKVLFE